ncbi:Phosphopantothenoylcysteine decarboxylase [Sesamum angolense]|uniref:phosphopantothenoylcysteine decarboxylase n=1 Tax=Sesamum angolense TaxID=2727404 RepID=A0AAE2C3G3_9LAMI|nr:Phosphopantothenoylcysteine decarboxylase [Sesamum angolense]
MCLGMAQPRPPNPYRELSQAKYAPRTPRIVVAACGTVAAVRFPDLCYYFREWADVKAVATRAALHFIDRSSLPRDVALYTDEDDWSTWKALGDSVLHIELRRWAEVMVIAPLSANTLGKIAGGLCDNLLTCLVRSWDYSKPLYVAPDMNPLTWQNSLTERHVMQLEDIGVFLIPPVTTRFPDGDYGTGAMEGPTRINLTVKEFLRSQGQSGWSNR